MCRKIAKRIIAIRETIDRLEDAQEVAQKCAQLIEEHKKDICTRADLGGDLEVFNRPDMENRKIKKKLTQMARWEFLRLPLILACSPFYDIFYPYKQAYPDIEDQNRQKKLKKLHRQCKIYQIPWIAILLLIVVILVNFVPPIGSFMFQAIINHYPCLTNIVDPHFRTFVGSVIFLLPVTVFCVIAIGIVETRNVREKMADPQKVTIHYTSKNDSCEDKKVPDGSEYFLIITFTNEHEISIDDFTARKTKTFGTATMGRLLAGIFSQKPVRETDITKVTYHFLSWKLDNKYQKQVKTHFPDADIQDPTGKIFGKTRVFTIQRELLGL
ncbi:hypothetical protein ACLUWS_08965 [Bifidobacterium boum]|uniref:hypothetical protein n=1 Tax=Bifidobacterium boum TaxID=78343 RepID=UPI003994C2CE